MTHSIPLFVFRLVSSCYETATRLSCRLVMKKKRMRPWVQWRRRWARSYTRWWAANLWNEPKVKGTCGKTEVESERNIIYYRHVHAAYTLFPHLTHLCLCSWLIKQKERDKKKTEDGQAGGRSIPHAHSPTYMNMRGEKNLEACCKSWAEDVIWQTGRGGMQVCGQELAFCFSSLSCVPCQQKQKWAMMKGEIGRCTWGVNCMGALGCLIQNKAHGHIAKKKLELRANIVREDIHPCPVRRTTN